MSYGKYNIQSSQTQRFIISDGSEKAGDLVKTASGKPCIPQNAVLTVNPPKAQGKTYIQGKAGLYVAPPNPDSVGEADKLVWHKTAYDWNAAPSGGTYAFWTLKPETNGYYIFNNAKMGENVEVAPGSSLTQFENFWSVFPV